MSMAAQIWNDCLMLPICEITSQFFATIQKAYKVLGVLSRSGIIGLSCLRKYQAADTLSFHKE